MADKGYTIGQAYIQIMPSTDKFGSAIKGEMDAEGESAGSSFSGGFKKGLEILGAAAVAAAAAVGKTLYDAIGEYANYEQLIGGVETLFKDSADVVSEYADNAYKTAGLSANEYMETVTSFSASLLQSLGGDTEKAAEYADMAITDMSDNANKMGTDMASIQNAYQGFAKQNYTMLDNLKLGYGGTKTEMERLIQDAEALDSSFQAARDENGALAMSYSDVVDAIHIVQTNMGITGTTAKEAATTVEGSAKSMKAAWANLITGLGNSNADIKSLVNDFAASFEGMLDNVLPVIKTAFSNIATALPELVDTLLPKVVNSITNMLPDLLQSVSSIIKSIGNALPDIVSNLNDMLPGILQDLLSNVGDILGSLLPALAETIIDTLANLPSMLAGAIGGIVEGVGNLISGISDSIKELGESSIPDDLADGYVGAITTNIGKKFSDGWSNLQLTIANIIGDTEWASYLEDMQLAQALQDKVVDDYNSAMAAMDEYDYESFTVKTETVVNSAMTLLGALEGMFDENGNLTGNITVAQTYIDQINSLLGGEAVTLDVTLTDWVVEIIDKYTDADGNYTQPDILRDEIAAELQKIFTDDIPLDQVDASWIVNLLESYTDENGRVDNPEDFRNAVVDSLNEQFATDIPLDSVDANWLVAIVDEYTDDSGHLTDPEALKNEIVRNLNSVFGGGNAIDLAEQTYNAVSTVLSQYSYSDAVEDKEGIKQKIEAKLEEAGTPEVEAKAIADATVEAGGLEYWYGTPKSTGWDNSAFIAWMIAQNYLPDPNSPDAEADATAYIVADMILKYQNGEMTADEFSAQLDELQLDDNEKNQVITYTLNEEAFQDTIEKMKELQRETYITKLTNIFADSVIDNVETFSSAMMNAKEAYASWDSGEGTSNLLSTFNEELNAAQMAYNAIAAEADKYYDSMFDYLGGEEALHVAREQFIEDSKASDITLQGQAASLEAMRQQQILFAAETLANVDSFNSLDYATNVAFRNTLGLAESWQEVWTMFGMSDGQAVALTETVAAMTDKFGALSGELDANTVGAISDWILENETANTSTGNYIRTLEAMGIDSLWLTDILIQLAENEALTGEEAEKAGDSMEEASGQAATLGEAVADAADAAGTATSDLVDNIVDNLEDGLPDVAAASEDITGAVEDDLYEMALNAEPFMQLCTTELSTTMLEGKDDVVGAVDEVIGAAADSANVLPEEMTTAGSGAGEGLNTGFGDWNSTVASTIYDMYVLFVWTLNDILPIVMKLWGSNAGAAFNTGLSSKTTDLASTASGIADKISNTFSGLQNDLDSAGRQAGYRFDSALASGTAGVYSTMYSAGSNAGEGLYNGLSSWYSSVYNKAMNMANAIASATKDALAVKSPSRVMMEIGEYTAEGMAIGLDKGSEKVLSSVQDMTDGVIRVSGNSDLMKAIEDSQSNYHNDLDYSQANREQSIEDSLDQITSLLDGLRNLKVVMDTGEVVGVLAAPMNDQLAMINMRERRG